MGGSSVVVGGAAAPLCPCPPAAPHSKWQTLKVPYPSHRFRLTDLLNEQFCAEKTYANKSITSYFTFILISYYVRCTEWAHKNNPLAKNYVFQQWQHEFKPNFHFSHNILLRQLVRFIYFLFIYLIITTQGRRPLTRCNKRKINRFSSYSSLQQHEGITNRKSCKKVVKIPQSADEKHTSPAQDDIACFFFFGTT